MTASKKHSVDAAVFRIDAAPFSSLTVPKPHTCLSGGAPEASKPEPAPPAEPPSVPSAPVVEQTPAGEIQSLSTSVVASVVSWTGEVESGNQDSDSQTSEVAEEVEVADEVLEPEEILSEDHVAPADGVTIEPPTPKPANAKPVWEVDRFRWPSLADRLMQEEEDYFGHAGQKLLEASKQGLKTLAVTSAAAGEGCTTLAICLARAAASTGARVALLDADLHNRQLATGLGLELSHGWLDVVSGEVPWTEAAVNSLQDSLAVVPAAPLSDRSPVSAGAGAPDVISSIADHFDLVVVDLGQFGPDVWHLLGNRGECVANAAIVVRDRRTTAEEDTLAVSAKLKRMGIQAVGIAENFSGVRRPAAA